MMIYTAKRNCGKLLLALGALLLCLLLPGVARADNYTWGDATPPTLAGAGPHTITVSNGASGTLTVPTGVTALTLTSSSSVTITDAALNFGNTTGVTLNLNNVNLHGADNSATGVLHWTSAATVTLNITGTAEIRAGMFESGFGSGCGVYCTTSNGTLKLASGTLRVYGGSGASSSNGHGIQGGSAIIGNVMIGQGATLYARGGDGGNATSSVSPFSGAPGAVGVNGDVTCHGTATLVGGDGGSAMAGRGGNGADGAYTSRGISGQGSLTLQGGTGGSSQSGAGGDGGAGLEFSHDFVISEGTYSITGGAGGSSQSGTGGVGGTGIFHGDSTKHITHKSGSTLAATGGAGGDVGPGGTPGGGGNAVWVPGDAGTVRPGSPSGTYTATDGAGGRVMYPPTNTSGDTYTPRTLTDKPTGVTVTGSMTSYARLTVRERVLHAEGACPACEEIRARMAAGELIVLYDISISGGYTGELEVSIPVGEQYNGQTVTILHCKNGVTESVTCVVQNGVATGTFKRLSPFAVVRSANVSVPENVVVNPPKTGTGSTAPFGAVLMACAVGLGLARRKQY